MFGVAWPGDQLEVHLDRHRLAAEAKFVQEGGKGDILGRLAGFAVDGDMHLSLGNPV
jgi:hypothetical protein